ncbi:hypothetical protein TorRG33x02_039350 [Trema orientale]|uniref:Uncharacterized protein n=1 Tax=Trema orientale TaxID=63057 RepID=A0A2P5FQU6_TREOI|nr:hypothetical protein TorRG33x02_039350 [Trema orientale]
MARPKPPRQLMARVVPPKPMFDDPTAVNVMGFMIGVPNRSLRQPEERSRRYVSSDESFTIKSFQHCNPVNFGANFRKDHEDFRSNSSDLMQQIRG